MTKRRLDTTNTKRFELVSWSSSQYTFVGGHCTKPRTVEVKTGTPWGSFIKLSTAEDWLVKAVCNTLVWNHNVTLISELRAEVKAAWKSASEPVIGGQTVHRQHRRLGVGPKDNNILHVIMPSICPQEEPNSGSECTIRLLLLDHQQVWLHIDDVEWAVRYMYAQHNLGIGQLVSDNECSSPDKGHCLVSCARICGDFVGPGCQRHGIV